MNGAPPLDRRGLIGLLVFTGLWAVAAVLVQVPGLVWWVASVVSTARAADARLGPFVTQRLQEMLDGGVMPPELIVPSLLLQFPAMIVCIELTRRIVVGIGGDAFAGPAREVYALAAPSAVGLGLGAALGLTTGWLPGWLAERMREWSIFPSLDAVALINRTLVEGPVVTRLTLAFVVVLAAPVVEELVFRGALWWMVARALTPAQTWIVTSLVFAAYHMDPIQAVPLIFTALVLGWVRWVTGSLWPGVALHLVNNALGVAGAVWGESVTSPGLLACLAAAFATLLGAELLRRMHPGASG